MKVENVEWYRIEAPWKDTRFGIIGDLLDETGEDQEWTFNANPLTLHRGPLVARMVRRGPIPSACIAGGVGVLVVTNEIEQEFRKIADGDYVGVPLWIRGQQTHQAISILTELDCVDETASQVEVVIDREGRRSYNLLQRTAFIPNRVTSPLFRLKYQWTMKFCACSVRKILEASGGCDLEFSSVRSV